MRGCCRALIFLLLLVGFTLFFRQIQVLSLARRAWMRTRADMDEAARQRMLQNRRNLLQMETAHSHWLRLERMLVYSGWQRRMPALTPERWIAGNVVAVACLVGMVLLWTARWRTALVVGVGALALEYLVLKICRGREMRSVNDNLLKFLDFLSNYSITAGEVTGIFHQISRYMDEPLRSALEECSYEAQTTGDVSLALLSMAERVEHPILQEIVRNVEVSVRYCADFTLLVSNSRRSVREYLRTRQEQSSMLREAMINMLLLTGMSFVAFLLVDELVDISIWQVLWHTFAGKVALAVIGIIFGLFAKKLYELNG